MNMQGQRFFDTRWFRIMVIAVAAVAVLALAAYWFGTGLRADTSASVAPSPPGSSLTAVRESVSEDYVERLFKASTAAKSSAADYASLGIPAAASVMDATRRIREGSTITVDGNTGTVTVH